jgi:hypothetical protein
MRFRDTDQYGLCRVFWITIRSIVLVIGLFGTIGCGFAGTFAFIHSRKATVFAAAPTSSTCVLLSIRESTSLNAPPPYLKTTPLRNTELAMLAPSRSTVVPFSKIPPYVIDRGGRGTTGTNALSVSPLLWANTNGDAPPWSIRNIQTIPSTNAPIAIVMPRMIPPFLVGASVSVVTFHKAEVPTRRHCDQHSTSTRMVKGIGIINVPIINQTVNTKIRFGRERLYQRPLISGNLRCESGTDDCVWNYKSPAPMLSAEGALYRIGRDKIIVGIFGTTIAPISSGSDTLNAGWSFADIFHAPIIENIFKGTLLISDEFKIAFLGIGGLTRDIANPRPVSCNRDGIGLFRLRNIRIQFLKLLSRRSSAFYQCCVRGVSGLLDFRILPDDLSELAAHHVKLAVINSSNVKSDGNRAGLKNHFPKWGLVGLGVGSFVMTLYGWWHLRNEVRITWGFCWWCTGIALWVYTVDIWIGHAMTP